MYQKQADYKHLDHHYKLCAWRLQCNWDARPLLTDCWRRQLLSSSLTQTNYTQTDKDQPQWNALYHGLLLARLYTECTTDRLVMLYGVFRRVWSVVVCSTPQRRVCNVTHQGTARDGGPVVLRPRYGDSLFKLC